MNAFLASLQAQAAIINTDSKPKKPITQSPAPIDPPSTSDKLIVTVERVINRKRLDVFFSRKPSDQILAQLRGQGFRFRPSDRAWYHQDNENNRLFCEINLGASFDDSDADTHAVITDDDTQAFKDSNQVTLTCAVSKSPSDSVTTAIDSVQSFTPEFERYKMQVNQLIEHLKMEPADLQLLAIDYLHKFIFHKPTIN